MKKLSKFAAVALLAALTACATAGTRTAVGAGGGAAAGAGIGALLGGWKGAAIGAGVGALTGGSVGLYLDKQAKELEAVAETKRTENGVLVNMKSEILFDTGSAVLKPEAVAQIQQVGDILAKYSDDRVQVLGHTDSTGRSSANEELSQRRANAVKEILVGRGVQQTQITALGMGQTKPIADNASAAGRAKNRRVEVHIDVPKPTA
ncbi:MAG TPA: OmpA family protein [Anaeromyxobacteraceae bacterium]|jgi:outer membrane protein OmpA-like peptidoglycan-associated protein|nr:OmpA family protein [Anaeromyxobacteraceae bacterium]